MALGTDSTTRTQYGFRYSSESANPFINTRTLSAASYNVTPACIAFWGGDTLLGSYGQTLQFVRMYIDYVPTSQDQMLNLAMMKPGGICSLCFHLFSNIKIMLGTLYYLLFTTDYDVVQNKSIPIQYYQNLTQGSTTASISNFQPHFLQTHFELFY